MKEQYKNMRLALIVLLSSLFLQACGGSSNNEPTFTISTNVSSVAFTNEFLQEETNTISVNVTFSGTGLLVGFAPNATPAAWLNYRVENLTATTATLHIDVTNANRLVANLYGTTVRLTSGDPATTNFAHQDINISLLVWQALTFDDTFGVNNINAKNVNVSSTADNLTLASSVPWLNVEKSFANGITTITATPDVSSITASGLYSGTIDITSPLGTTKHPVELSLDNIHLFADRDTVAFAQTGNINNSQTSLKINSNSATPWTWRAASNVSWLTLTANAETNQLHIAANPSTLTNNETSLAEITILAGEGTTAVEKTIPVSFYKSDGITDINNLELTANTNGIVIDPLLPQFYVATNNELQRYHLYTNELLSTTVVAPEEVLLEQLIIQPDAKLMLAKATETIVVDETTTNTVTHRYQINLSDMSINELAEADVDIVNDPLKFVSIDGRYFVVTTALEYADSNLKRLGLTNNTFFSAQFNVTSTNQALFALDTNNATIKRFLAKVNDFGRNPITVEETHSYRPESLAETDVITDFFATNDEKRLYLLSRNSDGSSRVARWLSFDGTTFNDNGLLATADTVVNLALARSNNDRANIVRFEPSTGFTIDVYNEQQAVANTITLGNNQPSDIIISADNNRAVLNSSSANAIEIVNLAQFSTSAATVSFKTNLGDSTIAEQKLTLANIGENWQATSSAPWLVLTQQAGDDENSILLNVDRSKITGWGLLTATITIFDPASGTSRVITVELAVDAIRIASNYPSLAFNALATQQTLSHKVEILTNSESNIVWQASTDVNWLSLSENRVDNSLTITALPANITGDGIHKATITLSPVSAGSALTGTINVTLNKGATDAIDVDITNVNINSSGLVLDPMRPMVYIADGDNIKTYNILTGALINTSVSPLAGVDLTNLVVHPDGSMLLASNSETFQDDSGADQTRINHYRFNLDNFQFTQINSENITIERRPILIKMVAGAPVVITQTLEYADIDLERQYWDRENAYFTSTIAQASNTDIIMAFKASSTSLERYVLDYNAYASEQVSATTQATYTNSAFTNLSSISMSNNGAIIYSANNTSEWANFTGDSYTNNGLLHSNNNVQSFRVTTDSADNSYFYRFNPSQGVTYTKYDNNQVESWVEVITSSSAQSYLMPAYQRVLIYDNNSSTLRLRSHP